MPTDRSLALAPCDASVEPFDPAGAFVRNLGLVSEVEQERLRRSTVAIAGVGGVGGGHAVTLARQGVGRFVLADPDRFALSNLNRQAGARMSTMGQPKVEVLRSMILDINPSAHVETWTHIDADNADAFVARADVVLDGIDFFAIEARRTLFASARRQNRWALTAGPLGFGASLVAFAPDGMSFDSYCDLSDAMTREEQIVAFALALAPRGLHIRYLDLARVDVASGAAPSSAIGCGMASTLIAMETIALLLGRRPPRRAPAYVQFDPYRRAFVRGRLFWGNRGPWQRLKRHVMMRRLRDMGVVARPLVPARV